MKLKRNKLFLIFGSLGVITTSCVVITSCGKSTNKFDTNDDNTTITLKSKNEAKQLYDCAITKIVNFEIPGD
jgi:hypothetical protein